MNQTLVDKVAEAVLYEGYILYPYRASSRKNRERFTFGRVYPREYSDGQHGAEPCVMQTECLVRRTPGGSVGGRVRFLHAMSREVCAGEDPEHCVVVPQLRVDGQVYQTWHEAVDREVALPELLVDSGGRRTMEFSFPGFEGMEGVSGGFLRRRQDRLEGDISLAVEPLDEGVSRLTVRITNRTPVEGMKDIVMRTFASTHTILQARGTEFISLTDPPADYALASTGCENIGTWPVLVGDTETMLSSPIILYDYPQIAPESPGGLCDGLEIDEILTLRVMTMTDEEKCEMRNVDAVARKILERTESLREEDLLKMHGTMREVRWPGSDFFDENTRLAHVIVKGVALQAGDRVRITPKGRADAMDLMLAGKVGVIEAIEQDAEGRVHLAIVLEEDPGRDLGMMRQPGHRFFYGLDEVEPVKEEV